MTKDEFRKLVIEEAGYIMISDDVPIFEKAFSKLLDEYESSKWQPIETVPKDGSIVELFVPAVKTGSYSKKRRPSAIQRNVYWSSAHRGFVHLDDYGDACLSKVALASHWRPYSGDPVTLPVKESEVTND